MEPLFKYMPSKYVTSLTQQGAVLYRNLSYFRKADDQGRRGDLFEGRHIDRPGQGVTLTNLRGVTIAAGDLAFINSVEAEKIFVFCMSTVLSDELFETFGADACVEIPSAAEFVRACRAALPRSWRLRCGRVEYYRVDRPAKRSVKSPSDLPFFKPESYSHQHEYRVVIWRTFPPVSLRRRITFGDAVKEIESESADSERARSRSIHFRSKKPSRRDLRVHAKGVVERHSR